FPRYVEQRPTPQPVIAPPIPRQTTPPRPNVYVNTRPAPTIAKKPQSNLTTYNLKPNGMPAAGSTPAVPDKVHKRPTLNVNLCGPMAESMDENVGGMLESVVTNEVTKMNADINALGEALLSDKAGETSSATAKAMLDDWKNIVDGGGGLA